MVALNKGLAVLAALPALSSASKPHSNLPFTQIPQASAHLSSQLLQHAQSDNLVALTSHGLDQSENSTPRTVNLSDYRLGVPKPSEPTNTNPLESLSYTKGDQATSLKEFTEAVSADYQVHGNRAARNNKKFSNRAIMIYGENHLDIRIPSLRNNKGAFLVESDDSRLQLEKHQQFASNTHQHIDAVSDKDIQQSYRPFVYMLTEMAESIDYDSVDQIRSELKPTDSGHVFVSKLIKFVKENFEQASNKKLEWERPWFKIQYDRLFQAHDALAKELEANFPDREAHMIEQTTKAIAQLKEDESATIVIGAAHLKPIAEALNRKFGKTTPIVACLPNSVAKPEYIPKL